MSRPMVPSTSMGTFKSARPSLNRLPLILTSTSAIFVSSFQASMEHQSLLSPQLSRPHLLRHSKTPCLQSQLRCTLQLSRAQQNPNLSPPPRASPANIPLSKHLHETMKAPSILSKARLLVRCSSSSRCATARLPMALGLTQMRST